MRRPVRKVCVFCFALNKGAAVKDEAVEMEAQEFASFERVGFTVVEWGGSEIKKP